MSPRRAALVERFRSRARESVEASVELFAGVTKPDEELLRERLGAWHTFKGESRMLGFVALADAVHATEDALHACSESWDAQARERSVRAMRVVDGMLEGTLADGDDARAGRDTVLAIVRGEEPAAAPNIADPTGPRPGAQGMLEVPVVQVDSFCERLEEMRAAFGRACADGAASPATLQDLHTRIDSLAVEAWELRLAPVEPLLTSLARHAEELSRERGVELRTVVDAEGAALDRRFLDALASPLLHLARNAVDHGFDRARQSGILRFAALARGGTIELVVADDGRGVDPVHLRSVAVERGVLSRESAAQLSDEDALDLLFLPGFSTRSTVSDLSGRGLGLDVVRRVVEGLGGSVGVASKLREGTSFTLVLPLGLARERVILVSIHGTVFGIGGRFVDRIERLEQVGQTTLRLEGSAVPVRSLAEVLGFSATDDESIALVLRVGARRWALALSAIEGESDVTRRPADAALSSFGIVGASAVLDDGRLVLLPGIGALVRVGVESPPRRAREPATRSEAARPRLRALVVDDSPIVRDLICELLVSADFSVTPADGGIAALDALDTLGDGAFDVIVSDLEMPHVDGLELLRRIRARRCPTPLVMVTTRGSLEDRRRASELGANGYVLKTEFDEGQLVGTVRRAVAEAR